MQAIVVFLFLGMFALPALLTAGTLNVRDAVKRGLATHPKLQSALATVQEAEGDRLTVLSPSSPTLAIEREGIPRGGGLSQYGEQRIAVSQELDFPLKYVWQASSTRSGIDASKQRALALLFDLEADIRRTFAEAYLLDKKVNILTANVEAARTYASQLERKVELGESVPLEARRSRVEHLQAKTMLDAVTKERLTVSSRLGRLIGVDISGVTLESPLSIIQTGESKSSEPSKGENPDLKAAESEVERANSELRIARAGWLPDLELSYFQQKAPAEANPNFWGVEAGLTLPIWFWLGGRGEIESASARRRASNAELADLRLETTSELDRLTQSIRSLKESYLLYQNEVVPAAKEAYDLAMRSFRLGEANYLQVLDAQRSALGIEIEYIEIESELSQSLVELDRLTGRSIIGVDQIQILLNKGK